MAQDPNYLIWIDLEMTGLSPESDKIIEIATIITDSNLAIVAQGPVLVVHQPNSILDDMDEWNTRTHKKTGLTDRVKNSRLSEVDVEAQTIDFLQRHIPKNKSPMCGNSICQDRRFLAKHMPELETYFHYRNLDVSTIKELMKRWRPDLLEGFAKKNSHTALDDIQESIDELIYYRKKFFSLAL